jgi:hypothetical protein
MPMITGNVNIKWQVNKCTPVPLCVELTLDVVKSSSAALWTEGESIKFN